ERRLCYVAITRAEKCLYLTHAMKRRVYGEELPSEPSRFLNEFPYELIEDQSKGPSWLRFANKTATKENHAALDALNARPTTPTNRTSPFTAKTYNSSDSVREFCARQGKKIDPDVFESRERRSESRAESSGGGSKRGSGLTVGTRVRHAKFGVGLIIKRE